MVWETPFDILNLYSINCLVRFKHAYLKYIVLYCRFLGR